jgi:hypothetical protein
MNSIWGGSKIKFNTSRGGSGKNVLMQTKKIRHKERLQRRLRRRRREEKSIGVEEVRSGQDKMAGNGYML